MECPFPLPSIALTGERSSVILSVTSKQNDLQHIGPRECIFLLSTPWLGNANPLADFWGGGNAKQQLFVGGNSHGNSALYALIRTSTYLHPKRCLRGLFVLGKLIQGHHKQTWCLAQALKRQNLQILSLKLSFNKLLHLCHRRRSSANSCIAVSTTKQGKRVPTIEDITT